MTNERQGAVRPAPQDGSETLGIDESLGASEESTQSNQLTYLTTEQVAIATGLSPSYWEKLRVAGGGPLYSKCGSSVRYHPNDIAQFMAIRRQTSTSQIGHVARQFLPVSTVAQER